MSILTDFFIATEEELVAAFPLRYPVAKRPKLRKTKNPFTGEAVTVKEWGPAKPFPPTAEGVTYPSKDEGKAVRRLPLLQLKGVDPVKLASLWSILGGGEWLPLVDELMRPALLAPGDDFNRLYRMPQKWVEAVAGIGTIAPVAKLWAATDEFNFVKWRLADAREILNPLRELAKRALAESKGMFLWVIV